MSQGRWVLWVGLAVVLLLVWAPPALVLVAGWPGARGPGDITPQKQAVEPIAGPPPATGLPPVMIRWMLVAGAISLGFALGTWMLALLLRKESESTPPGTVRPRLVLLIFLGLASLVTYALDFLWPFPLQRYYSLKGISMGVIADRNGDVALAVALATAGLFLLYTLAHRFCRGENDRRLWAVIFLGALLFALANLFVATTTTLDPYDYIARGRITGIYGGNPYVYAPSAYPADPFLGYVSWRDRTSAYGPLWETFSALLARLAGNGLWMNLMAHKLLALASYLLSTVLVAATLRRVAPSRALAGTLLFAWNPLILMEGLANAHNDLLMVAFLLAALWVLSYAQPVSEADEAPRPLGRLLLYGGLATFLLAAAVLIKFVPILFLPLFLLYLLAGEKDWLRWVGRALLLLIPFALLVGVCYFVFWKWPEVASPLLRRVDMYRMSVASISREALLPRVPEPTTLQALSQWPFLGLFVLGYLLVLGRAVWNSVRTRSLLGYQLSLIGGGLAGVLAGAVWWWVGAWALVLGSSWGRSLLGIDGLVMTAALGALVGAGLGLAVVALTRGWKSSQDHHWEHLLLACSSAFLLYLLLANFWFWPWYLIVPIALLALSGEERLFAPLALAACAGELSHLGWNFLWYWWGISWDTVYQMDALTVFGMVVPALVTYAVLGLKGWSRTRREAKSA